MDFQRSGQVCNAGNDDLLSGNSERNSLAGGSGSDQLRGAGGHDVLIGGPGRNFFRCDTKIAGNIDGILDFSSTDDTIRLDNAIFKSLNKNGALRAGNYCAGANATARDGNDFILYNTANGALAYDADGNGPVKAIRFATLWDGPGSHPLASEIGPLDFVIV